MTCSPAPEVAGYLLRMPNRIRWKDDPELRERFKGRRSRRPAYLFRGRRVTQGSCAICGEYTPKKARVITTDWKDGNGDFIQIRETFVSCKYPHHGDTALFKERI